MDGFDLIKGLTFLGLAACIAFVGLYMWHTSKSSRNSYNLSPFGVLFWVFAGLTLTVGLAWATAAGEGVSCKNNAAQMGREYHYSMSTTCMVNDQGRWIPLDQVFNNQQSGG